MKTKILLSVLMLSFISLQCKKHKENDPCKDQKPFKTDFKMFSKDRWSKSPTGDTLIEINDGDTCIGGFVYFKAIENGNYSNSYDSVNWIFGNPLNTSKLREAQLVFGIQEFNIPISLTGYKRKTSVVECFPNVATTQTVIKKLSVNGTYNDLPIVGNFFGANTDNPSDTFTVSVRFEPARDFLVIKNFPKGNMGFQYGVLPPPIAAYVGINPRVYGYNYILIDNENGLVSTLSHGPLYGVAKVINGNRMEINYQQFTLLDAQGYWLNPVQKKFIGIRR